MEELGTQNSSTLHIKVTVESNRDGLEENDFNSSNEASLLQPGSSNVTRSNSMRTSRWDEAMPKHLEPRPPTRPVRKTISRSLSPRPRKPISLASLRPPPPSPTWSGPHESVTSPTMLLPTRSPTPPQTTGTSTSSHTNSTKTIPIHVNINNKHLETFSSTGWSSAPTTPTSMRKTLDVPGRLSSQGSTFQNNTFLRSDRSSSPSPTRDPSMKGSSRIPRIDTHINKTQPRNIADSVSPSRYLDNLSSRQKRGESPVIIYDKNNDKYTSPLILEIRKKHETTSSEEKNIGGVKLSNLTLPTSRKLGSLSHDAANCDKNTEKNVFIPRTNNLHSETKISAPSSPRSAQRAALTSSKTKSTNSSTPPTIRKVGTSPAANRPSSPSCRKNPNSSGSSTHTSTPTSSSSPRLQNLSSASTSSNGGAQNLYLAQSPKSPSLVSKFNRSSGRIKSLYNQLLSSSHELKPNIKCK